MEYIYLRYFTSVRLCEVCPPDEAEAARAGVHGAHVARRQAGVEMIRVEGLVSIYGKVATRVVWGAHPDLDEKNKQDVKDHKVCASRFNK